MCLLTSWATSRTTAPTSWLPSTTAGGPLTQCWIPQVGGVNLAGTLNSVAEFGRGRVGMQAAPGSAGHASPPCPRCQMSRRNRSGHSSAPTTERHRCARSFSKTARGEQKASERDGIITPTSCFGSGHYRLRTLFGIFLSRVCVCVSEVKWGCLEPGVGDNSPRADT